MIKLQTQQQTLKHHETSKPFSTTINRVIWKWAEYFRVGRAQKPNELGLKTKQRCLLSRLS